MASLWSSESNYFNCPVPSIFTLLFTYFSLKMFPVERTAKSFAPCRLTPPTKLPLIRWSWQPVCSLRSVLVCDCTATIVVSALKQLYILKIETQQRSVKFHQLLSSDFNLLEHSDFRANQTKITKAEIPTLYFCCIQPQKTEITIKAIFSKPNL